MTLAWKQNPSAELARLAWPIATSTISYSLMTLVDTLLIGRVGRSELAGVALGGLSAFVVLCFSLGLLRGANTLVAQAVGARRSEEIAPLRAAALATGLSLGVVTALAGVAVAQLLPLVAATEAAGRAATDYLSIRVLGAPILLTYVALREVRYGRGDARSPMVATVAANLVNIALCTLFVFGLGWSVKGAALATVIANGVELGVLVLVQRGEAWRLGSLQRRHLRALWAIGAPSGVQFLLEVGAFTLLTISISVFSEAQMAAHQIAIQVIHFTFLPAWAVGEAAAVLAGQAVGAREDALVVRVGRIGAALSGAYAALCALVLAVAAPPIARAFTTDAAVVSAAIPLLYVAAVFQVFDAANVVARGVLRGAGDVRYAAVVGVLTAWCATPPLAWLLGYHLGMGAFGGWIGLCLEIVVSSAILGWRVERGGWLPAAARARDKLGERGPDDAPSAAVA